MTPTKIDSTLPSLTAIVPEVARDLAAELVDVLMMSGMPGMLKTVSALATSIVLRDPELFHALSAIARTRGNGEAPDRALSVAMHYAHENPAESRDALARLVTDAIERGLRSVPIQKGERVDPLLAACVDVVEIVHALALSRFAIARSFTSESASERMHQRRRVTRDFEAVSAEIPGQNAPPRSPLTNTSAPPRSTMRPAPARSTMRPSAKNNTLRPPSPTSDVHEEAVLTPRTQVRDAHGRPLKKKW